MSNQVVGDHDLVRLSVNLHPKTAAFLKDTADRHGVAITDVLWHAISIEKLIEDGSRRGVTYGTEKCFGRKRSVIVPIGEYDWKSKQEVEA